MSRFLICIFVIFLACDDESGPTDNNNGDTTNSIGTGEGSANRLRLEGEIKDIAVGECYPFDVVRYQSIKRDSSAAESADSEAMVVDLHANDSLSVPTSPLFTNFYSDADCSEVISQLTIDGGAGRKTAYLRSLKAEHRYFWAAYEDFEFEPMARNSLSVDVLGTWSYGCQDEAAGSSSETLILQLETINELDAYTWELTRNEYSDSACATLGLVFVQGGRFELEEGYGDYEYPLEITFTQTSSILEPKTSANVTAMNSGSYCGYNDWVLDTGKSTHDLSTSDALFCPGYTSTDGYARNLLGISEGSLKFGAELLASYAVINAQKERPTSLSDLVFSLD